MAKDTLTKATIYGGGIATALADRFFLVSTARADGIPEDLTTDFTASHFRWKNISQPAKSKTSSSVFLAERRLGRIARGTPESMQGSAITSDPGPTVKQQLPTPEPLAAAPQLTDDKGALPEMQMGNRQTVVLATLTEVVNAAVLSRSGIVAFTRHIRSVSTKRTMEDPYTPCQKQPFPAETTAWTRGCTEPWEGAKTPVPAGVTHVPQTLPSVCDPAV
ncbi:hypothetical protein E4U59_006727 [Claviceps monticola]|nr:hypothetical protein E4U59_006727 [Claviceps monticola]